MWGPMSRWPIGILAVALLGTGSTACERKPADLREWTVEDHDHQAKTRGSRLAAEQPVVKDTRAPPSPRNVLVEVTWAKQCASCHGRRGRGDGPSSTLVKARDLSQPEWQSSVTDDALAKVIREGKGQMPAFNLPDSLVTELVAHIRNMERKARRKPGEARAAGEDDSEQDEAEEQSGSSDAPASNSADAPAASRSGAPAKSNPPPATAATPRR